MRILAVVLSAAACLAQTPTIEQSLNMRSVSSPRISPDGRWVAYQVSRTNWEDNSFETEIWCHSEERNEDFRLAAAGKSSHSPVWSPDSRRLAFLSDRDGKSKLYLISPAGGEAVVLPMEEMGISGVEWSPDGKSIAFLSSGPETGQEKERKKKYGEFTVEGEDHKHSHLWLLKVPEDLAGIRDKLKPEALTTGKDFSLAGFSWSPDGKFIAFTAGSDPDFSSSHTIDLYLLRVSDKSYKRLVDSYGPESNPRWSPDSRRIVFQTANGQQYYYYLNSRLAVIPVEGGTPKILTGSFDEEPYLSGWTPAGIWFGAQQRTSAAVFRLSPETSQVEKVTDNSRLSTTNFSFSSDGRKAAFIGSAPNRFAEVYVSELPAFAPRAITRMSDQYKDFKLAVKEVIEWKSQDGTPIEGILIKPADYDPARKYPLLVVIHGGPTGVDTPFLTADRTYPLERFAAKGALILRPNYRGSAGYGEKFRSLNVRNLGVGDAWDVISGVDHLVRKGLVDGSRVGAMGWSQGGYISAFLTCSSGRFKAVSVGAGISDWMTYYVNTDIHAFTRQYLKATPWEDPEIYRKTSPISYVNQARTPTLIQHGDNDKRVPLPNAYELYQALQDRKVPVRLVVYKGFGHGINKPREQRHLMEQNYEWFSKYIWGKSPAR
ncbi:MAG: S9 family peptidase [Bryobacterales bacterium]|nr:S9 family peptidase [Bryobacterales bacterium]